MEGKWDPKLSFIFNLHRLAVAIVVDAKAESEDDGRCANIKTWPWLKHMQPK